MTAPRITREERLAEALRANLRRRKAQARERDAPAGDAPGGNAAVPPAGERTA